MMITQASVESIVKIIGKIILFCPKFSLGHSKDFKHYKHKNAPKHFS